jgi:hypothetical protein
LSLPASCSLSDRQSSPDASDVKQTLLKSSRQYVELSSQTAQLDLEKKKAGQPRLLYPMELCYGASVP